MPVTDRGQKITVHCTGYGKNRDLKQKFWSTKDPGQVRSRAFTPVPKESELGSVSSRTGMACRTPRSAKVALERVSLTLFPLFSYSNNLVNRVALRSEVEII